MKQPAKKLTLAILVVVCAVGLIGCFVDSFSMEKFSQFMIAFSPFYLGMVASVGTGSVVSKIQEGKRDRKTDI